MSATEAAIDTPRASEHFRERVLDPEARRVLISRLAGSNQEADITTPTNCNGYGRIRHFRVETTKGWPSNPLPIVPACRALGIDPCPSVMRAQVFQVAGCPWRCWYCFVPYELLRADLSKSRWFSSGELIELYRSQDDAPRIIDLSGGSPDLVPEWTIWMMDALKDAGLAESTYLWTDDNLSTTYLLDSLSKSQLKQLSSYRNYGRVCCFKGFDTESFCFNTRALEAGYLQQFEIMRRMLAIGIDLYGYVTLTGPSDSYVAARVGAFVDQLQDVDEFLPLRVIPLEIQVFSTVAARVTPAREKSMRVQQEAIAAWNHELASRFHALIEAPIGSIPLGGGR